MPVGLERLGAENAVIEHTLHAVAVAAVLGRAQQVARDLEVGVGATGSLETGVRFGETLADFAAAGFAEIFVGSPATGGKTLRGRARIQIRCARRANISRCPEQSRPAWRCSLRSRDYKHACGATHSVLQQAGPNTNRRPENGYRDRDSGCRRRAARRERSSRAACRVRPSRRTRRDAGSAYCSARERPRGGKCVITESNVASSALNACGSPANSCASIMPIEILS